MGVAAFSTVALSWPAAYRIVPARYPPIDLFERVTDDSAKWALLADIERLTNPRVRDEIGDIHLVPVDQRVSGPGASWIMAPFTHLNPRGSWFSDGTYGVYYAADRLATAVQETVFHMARFYSDSDDDPHDEDMRVLIGAVDGRFIELSRNPAAAPFLDPDSYAESQAFGHQIRHTGGDGIVYPSVRNPPHPCVAAFRPKVVGIPTQERHLKYHWDGISISRVFDYTKEQWHPTVDFH